MKKTLNTHLPNKGAHEDNKHIKIFNFICYQEMKIYIQYYYPFIKMAKIKKDDNIMCWQGFGTHGIARREKKAFLSDQYKETEEYNKMGKTRDLFKKIRDTKEHFMQRWAQ